MALIDWHNKRYDGKVVLKVSDPKVLQPINCLFHPEYSVHAGELLQLWVLQNYTLINTKQAAGYSVHCLDKDFREIFSQYVPSHENATMFTKGE